MPEQKIKIGDMVIKIGDRIKFRSACRCEDRVAVRKVTGFDERGRPLVRYQGWRDFIVFRNEVREVVA